MIVQRDWKDYRCLHLIFAHGTVSVAREIDNAELNTVEVYT